MKHSLATILLEAVERAGGPVTTAALVKIAYAEEHRPAKAKTMHNLKLLQTNGYIRPWKKDRNGEAISWVPTAGRSVGR